MVDSRNVTRQGIVISEKFFWRAGLKYASHLTGGVDTAARDQEMQQLGVTKLFALQIVGNNYRFLTKAVVLRGLKDEVNLGSAFLQRIGARGVTVMMRFDGWGTQLCVGEDTLDLIHKLPTDVGHRFAANEEYNQGTQGREYPSSNSDREDREYKEDVSD